jgi:hypothetical protein
MLGLPFERVIISHGEPVHTRDAFKRALELPQWPAGPLHLAAYRGNLDRVRSLIETGADLTARDERFGATALDWARWAKQGAVVAYLASVMKEGILRVTDGPKSCERSAPAPRQLCPDQRAPS